MSLSIITAFYLVWLVRLNSNKSKIASNGICDTRASVFRHAVHIATLIPNANGHGNFVIGTALNSRQLIGAGNRLALSVNATSIIGEVQISCSNNSVSCLKLTEISSTLQIGLPLVKYRVKQAKTHLERLLREE